MSGSQPPFVLLDTHALLWAVAEPERLGPDIAALLRNDRCEVLVSAASAWEIATKHRLGRLPQAGDLLATWDETLRLRARPIGVDHGEARRAGSFDVPHRDRFDRRLAAQAELRNIPLATTDEALSAFPINVIW